MNRIHAGRPQRPKVKALLNIGIKYFDSATHSCVLGTVVMLLTTSKAFSRHDNQTLLSAGPEHKN